MWVESLASFASMHHWFSLALPMKKEVNLDEPGLWSALNSPAAVCLNRTPHDTDLANDECNCLHSLALHRRRTPLRFYEHAKSLPIQYICLSSVIATPNV
jgi:hypothetical protein